MDKKVDDSVQDAAGPMKARLRVALKISMRQRDTARVRVLRALVAALDNAEAVPPEDSHGRYVVLTFGDRSGEVPRLSLTQWHVAALLRAEGRIAQNRRIRDVGAEQVG